jgi:ABC-type transporter Mla subunit MlaD
MRPNQRLSLFALSVAVCGLFAVWPVELGGQQSKNVSVRIDADDIGGIVTGANGPEAGVWIIAETTDLPTKFVKIVVTDVW